MSSLTKIIAVSLVGFIAASALVLFLAKPLLGQIDALHETQAKQEGELAQLNAQLSAFDQAKNQLKQVNYTEAVDNSIVVREDLAVVLAEVEADAGKAGITESIRITDDEAVGAAKTKPIIAGERNISEVPYAMTFSGDFTQVLEFMQYLEHLSHFTEVSDVAMSAVIAKQGSSETAHATSVTGTISGVFFIKKE